ncbi:MAG: hypothetical protein ABJB95_04865 [Gemmatimonadales bacterium]
MTMTPVLSITPSFQGGTNATSRPATTSEAPTAADRRELQDAARTLREAIQNNVRREINAAQAGADVQIPPVPPMPPENPQTITIRGRDGTAQTIVVPSHLLQNTIPQQAVDISIAFFLCVAFIIVGLPLARAFARRMDKRSGGAPQLSAEVSSQLAQLNQSVDAIALEVERISEGQRYTTRLLSEREPSRQTLPAGNR